MGRCRVADLEIPSPPLCCLVRGESKAPRCLHCGATICAHCRTHYHAIESDMEQLSEHFYNGVCRVRPHKEIITRAEENRRETMRLRADKSYFISSQQYEKAAKARDSEVDTFRGDIGKRRW